MLPSTSSRLSYTARRAFALLLVYGHLGISYDDLAATLGCERTTAIVVIRRLELQGHIKVIRSNGRIPNRYLPV